MQGKDIVVIAITQQGILNLSKAIFSHASSNTIFVDTGNYYPGVRDMRIPEIDNGAVESQWVSQQLGIPVIKTFNNITVWSLATKMQPTGAAGRICISVAGDYGRRG